MEELDIECPYCGETISVLIDTSAGEQDYYEDCSVCCCAILFETGADELGNNRILVRRDDE